jgi:hypothetical protein
MFLVFLFSVLAAIGSLVDLKFSLENGSLWNAIYDFLFFLVFTLSSSIVLSLFVREVVSQVSSKVY